jgi:hypothetical protein
MDRERFDRLSRLVAAAGTRRDALRLLLGGALAGAVVGAEGKAAKKRKRSRAGKRGKLRAQQVEPLCPTTCNQNCSNKPIRGGVNLTKCDLSERDLDDVKLNGANLTKVCFEGSSLRNVNFRGAQLQGTCFCGADLRGADFRGTGVTQAQLDCAAILGCDTILPTGKRAVVCEADETCCDGFCVNTRTDPDNCGVCGTTCEACQGCAGGTCEDLPDLLFDCSRVPLEQRGLELCTEGGNTGICDGGFCNCGPGGRYDEEANICRCAQAGIDFCEEEFGQCCAIQATCIAAGVFRTEITCPVCAPGAPA